MAGPGSTNISLLFHSRVEVIDMAAIFFMVYSYFLPLHWFTAHN